MLTKLQIRVIKGVGEEVPVVVAVLADVRYISRISIRNIIHVCRSPIHFRGRCVYTFRCIRTRARKDVEENSETAECEKEEQRDALWRGFEKTGGGGW